MLLAQATSAPVVHANGLYFQWGLLAAVIGICAAITAKLSSVMARKSNETTAAGLKIRSSLVSLFQSTVVYEAKRLFDLVDNHLPYALSQVDAVVARPSA